MVIFHSFFIVDFPSFVNGPMFNRYVSAAQISGDLLRHFGLGRPGKKKTRFVAGNTIVMILTRDWGIPRCLRVGFWPVLA